MLNKGMTGINHWINFKILNAIALLAKKHGVDFNSKDCNMKKCSSSVSFTYFSLSKKSNPNELVILENVLCKLSVWRSLCNWALVGELCIDNISCNIRSVSSRIFKLDNAIITFKIRKRYQIACIDIENFSSTIQLTSRKKNKMLIIDVPEFAWNDIHSLLSKNFTSDILSKLCSKNRFYFQVCIEKLESSQTPIVYASLTYDGTLSFYHNISKENKYVIDRTYLVDLLKEKLNCGEKSYILYDSIPKRIIDVMISTEDPLFWKHKGVAIDFIGLALAQNLKEYRIVRGASTITMQLVRNLFLSHDRNLFRKIEEIILALLLENYYEIDKKVIIELYINLIEFAPDIYGLFNASIFYFAKEYKELTLIEILALTYIIPRPQHFYEALIQQSPQLKVNLYNHISKLLHKLLLKGLIIVDEYINLGVVLCFAKGHGSYNFKEFIEAERKEAFSSLRKMHDVHPDLINIVQDALKTTPILFVITEGVRMADRQMELYAKGRIKSGTIVTNCDGIEVKSKHQLGSEGYGYAVDLYPYICGRRRMHESYVSDIFQIIARHIKSVAQEKGISIVWGGDWKMKDYSHFELEIVC